MPISLSGSLNLSGSLTTTGTITATTLVVQTITSSISSITGSTNFGSLSSDTHKFTGSLNVTGAFYITTGSVGIGTVSPSQKLEVVGGEIKAGRVDTNQEGGQVSFGRASDNNTSWYIDLYGSSTSPQLRFVDVDNSAVRMTLTGSNVGIGTTTPSGLLQVGVANSGIYFDVSTQYTPKIKAAGTISDIQIESVGSGGNVYLTAPGATSLITLSTAGSERMRISSTGNVSINSGGYSFIKLFVKGVDATSSNYALICNNINDTGLFQVRNDGWLISPTTYNNTSGVAANVGIDSSGNIFRATSSSKYKKDIKPYDKGLDTVLLMNPIYYKSKSEFDGDKQFAGFIAEEINTLCLNEFVQYNDENNEPEGLNYGNMTALLVKAIQELTARVQELENK
jgi:hypothetical protein